MEPVFTIDADHDLKLIRYRHTGSLGYDDIGRAWQVLLGMNEFTVEKYDLLSDYRNSVFDMELHEAERIVAFMMNIRHVVEGKKQALVVDDPYSTAGSIIFQDKVFRAVGFIVETFSTPEAALDWLRPA